jgi:hypothetical protein
MTTKTERSRWKILWISGGLSFAGLVAVALYTAWPLLHPTLLEVAAPDPDCDLRAGACEVRFDDGRGVRLGIEPRTFQAMTPLRLTVTTEGLEAHAVEVDFVGVEMNMGYNRVGLARVSADQYAGEGMLPVCVLARMDWEARVLIHTAAGILAAPFRFATYRD